MINLFKPISMLGVLVLGASVGGIVTRLAHRLTCESRAHSDELVQASEGRSSADRAVRRLSDPTAQTYERWYCSILSGRYLLGEVTLACSALYLCLTYSPADAFARLALCAALVCVSLVDFDCRIVPDVISLPGIPIGILLGGFVISGVGIESALQGLGGSSILLLLGESYRWLRGRVGMGLGDVKLAAMIGAFLGWPGLLFTIVAGSLMGALGGMIAGLSRYYRSRGRVVSALAEDRSSMAEETGSAVREALSTAVPLAPFLSIAAAAYALFQPQLVRW